MYNYREYKKMKNGTPTCGECKFFIESENGCKKFPILIGIYEHTDACPKDFDSHYEG